MSVTTDIVQSWTQPRAVMRRHLARGVSEAFAFALLFVFLLITFVALTPQVARETALEARPSVLPGLLATAMAVLATLPLWYAIAAISRLVARLFGGKGTWYTARIALFAALVAITPLVLLQGLVSGFLGQSPTLLAVQVLVGVGLIYVWINMLIEAER